MKAFVESQFSYCLLIWIFHSWELTNKINRIHERALRITLNDKSSTLSLLNKDSSVAICHKNIRALATEMYKTLQGYYPVTLNEVFVPSHCRYNLRKNNSLERRRVNTVRYGI